MAESVNPRSWGGEGSTTYDMYPHKFGAETPPVETESPYSERNEGGLGHGEYGVDFDTTGPSEAVVMAKAEAEARNAVQRAFGVQ